MILEGGNKNIKNIDKTSDREGRRLSALKYSTEEYDSEGFLEKKQ